MGDEESLSARPSRRKGCLAFFPDSVSLFPRAETTFQPPSLHSVLRNRTKPSKPSFLIQKSINEWIGDKNVVSILVDPVQPSSLRLVHEFSRVLGNQDQVNGLVVSNSTEECFDWLDGSGLAMVRLEHCSSMLQMALGWTSCPALAVVECKMGRKVSKTSEEWASLNANAVECWANGESALSWHQSAQAAIVSPAACSIT